MNKKRTEPGALGDYEVGYGKPPQASRFKPGQSGNPKGRPSGRKNLKTILEDILYQPVTITEGGKPRKVPAIEALVKSLLVNAMKGDARATDRLLKQLALLNQHAAAAPGEHDGAGIDPARDIELIESFAAMMREAGMIEEPDNES